MNEKAVRNLEYKFRRYIKRMGARRGFNLKTLSAKMKVRSNLLRLQLQGKLPIRLSDIVKLESALEMSLISFPNYKYNKDEKQ